jgi:hypothetical protein
MLTFLTGLATGLILAVAVGAWMGSRVSKRQRRITAAVAAFQQSVFDVQDAVAMGLSADTCNNLRTIRDQALTAYLAAMGE